MTIHDVEDVICQKVGEKYRKEVVELVQIIEQTNPQTRKGVQERIISSSALVDIIRGLSDCEFITPTTTVRFGRGEKIRTIIINSGGNIIRLSVPLQYVHLQQQSKPAFFLERIFKLYGWIRRNPAVAFFIFIVGILMPGILEISANFQPALDLFEKWGIYRPAPFVMNGDYNVAVAEFGEISEDGRVLHSTEARRLSEAIFIKYTDSLTTTSDVDFETQSPRYIPVILGSTTQERAIAAASIAQSVHADILIYGYIDSHKDLFMVNVYLSPVKLLDAEELAGEYSLGTLFHINTSAENPALRSRLSKELEGRTRVLALFTLGLGYFALDDIPSAALHFRSADQEGYWDSDEGKEILYLFLGTTSGKLKELNEAEQYYNKALTINPKYSRALLGLAEVSFQRARAESCAAGTVNVEELQRAIRGFQSASSAEAVQENNIETKISLFLGRAFLCMARGVDPKYWDDAEIQFRQVVDDYDLENKRIQNLAAEAHGYLGLLILLRTDKSIPVSDAIPEFTRAIGLTQQPRRRALFNLWLAYIYSQVADCALADSALAHAGEAEKLAPQLDVEYEKFRERIMDIRQNVTCKSAPTSTSK